MRAKINFVVAILMGVLLIIAGTTNFTLGIALDTIGLIFNVAWVIAMNPVSFESEEEKETPT